jgi:hypothetical protein
MYTKDTGVPILLAGSNGQTPTNSKGEIEYIQLTPYPQDKCPSGSDGLFPTNQTNPDGSTTCGSFYNNFCNNIWNMSCNAYQGKDQRYTLIPDCNCYNSPFLKNPKVAGISGGAVAKPGAIDPNCYNTVSKPDFGWTPYMNKTFFDQVGTSITLCQSDIDLVNDEIGGSVKITQEDDQSCSSSGNKQSETKTTGTKTTGTKTSETKTTGTKTNKDTETTHKIPTKTTTTTTKKDKIMEYTVIGGGVLCCSCILLAVLIYFMMR